MQSPWIPPQGNRIINVSRWSGHSIRVSCSPLQWSPPHDCERHAYEPALGHAGGRDCGSSCGAHPASPPTLPHAHRYPGRPRWGRHLGGHGAIWATPTAWAGDIAGLAPWYSLARHLRPGLGGAGGGAVDSLLPALGPVSSDRLEGPGRGPGRPDRPWVPSPRRRATPAASRPGLGAGPPPGAGPNGRQP